jgi:hypothetical protein
MVGLISFSHLCILSILLSYTSPFLLSGIRYTLKHFDMVR